ncbi:MAG: SDR family NAD(P)-dependent oxidoreductase [Oscillospiraceae bacterium]|jgi:NAD(P)-dependent dehydrogenase (short-subunit alcohol dehydrogenase family)
MENISRDMPSLDFSGKSVIVTGSTTGIGRAIAMMFAKLGARVVVCNPIQAECDTVAEEIEAGGGRASAIKADISDAEDVENLVKKTVEAFGGIDILINNAGIGGSVKPFVDTTHSDWDEVMAVNLRGTYMLSKLVARQMIEQGRGGRIVNISSIASLEGSGHHTAYGASKAGVNSLTRTMAYELGKYGITVNAICPGFVETEITRRLLEDPEKREAIIKSNPMRKVGKPEDIASVAVFLASDCNSFLTGTQVVVDGGRSAGPI